MISSYKIVFIILILTYFFQLGCSKTNTAPDEKAPIVNPDDAILEIITMQQSNTQYNCGFIKIQCNITGAEKSIQKTMPDSGGVVFIFNKNDIDPNCEQISFSKIIIFDHLFNETNSIDVQISLTYGHKETRQFIIDAENLNVYWERLDFTQNYELANKKVLVIVGNDFDYLEYCMIPNYLQYYGAEITSASNQINRQAHYWNVTDAGAYKKIDTSATVDIVLDSIDISLYDCIFLPGGNGPKNLLTEYPQTTDLIFEANNQGMLLSAICHGPLLLAESNVIDDKQVTGFPDIVNLLEEHGGVYVQSKVVVDGNIITGNWPYFNSVGTAIAENLENR